MNVDHHHSSNEERATWLPGSVRMVTVLGMCLGVIRLGVAMFTLIPFLRRLPSTKITGSPQDIMAATTMAEVLLWLMLLIGSIGARHLDRWARFLMNFFAVSMILLTVGKMVYVFNYVATTAPRTDVMSGPRMVGTVLSGIVYPLGVLIVMNRREVRRLFTGGRVWPGMM